MEIYLRSNVRVGFDFFQKCVNPNVYIGQSRPGAVVELPANTVQERDLEEADRRQYRALN